MLSPSDEPEVDVDYSFAQVAVGERLVDYRPTCDTILVGVGPAAIEMGLVPVRGARTPVRIRAVTTCALVEAIVQTPDGRVEYEGETAIDGVPGTAAPLELRFLDVAGKSCGAMLPTGQPREAIAGIEVTLLDVAMPMVIARAADFGRPARRRLRPSMPAPTSTLASNRSGSRRAGGWGLGMSASRSCPRWG
jgi:2-methylaconitate cis-trans-isomerase PrpF